MRAAVSREKLNLLLNPLCSALRLGPAAKPGHLPPAFLWPLNQAARKVRKVKGLWDLSKITGLQILGVPWAAPSAHNASLCPAAGHSRVGRGVPLFQVADSWPCVFNHSFYSSEIFNERVEFARSSLRVLGERCG